MKYRMLAVILAAAFLAGAGALYKGDFWTLRTEEQKINAITEYASNTESHESHLRAWLHPVPLQDEIIGSHRVLTFTDSEIDGLLGHVVFRRGFFGGWQPLSAGYTAGPALRSFRLEAENVHVVYAAGCPAEIAHYKIQANLSEPETLMAEGDVTEPRFLHVHPTDRNYFPDLHLYDAEGRKLDDRDYLCSDPSVPSPSIGSAETDLVYVFCGIILLAGAAVVQYCWQAGKKETA